MKTKCNENAMRRNEAEQVSAVGSTPSVTSTCRAAEIDMLISNIAALSVTHPQAWEAHRHKGRTARRGLLESPVCTQHDHATD
jgi:hypothetical protein